ncbi:transmembrane protein 222 isoform X2 [Dermacentor andersoni]|uniref:transmembrane protein 222 isoform X2 n=1 Tax=Dermacentor andersoni TaxID=34620 RepID=UPI003B3B119E
MKMSPKPSIDFNRDRFPFCIVWTPIPCLTWLCPLIGHMGICMSTGIIRDFAGPYYVSEDNMAFGRPAKYWMLDPSKARDGVQGWDRGVVEGSEEYRGHMVGMLNIMLAQEKAVVLSRPLPQPLL